jgi:hypothetical protein
MLRPRIIDSRRGLPRPSTIALVALATITADYFLDPYRGRGRRGMLRSQTRAMVRRAAHRLSAYLHYKEGKGRGLLEHRFHLHSPDNPVPDDLTLRDRVESQLFRDRTVPKGSINVSVCFRTVELRGQVPDRAAIDRIVERVLAVPDVGGVRSYLHVPDTPAPKEAPALTPAHQ